PAQRRAGGGRREAPLRDMSALVAVDRGSGRRRLRRNRGEVVGAGSRRPLGDLVRSLPDGEPGTGTAGRGTCRRTEAGQGRRGQGAGDSAAVLHSGSADADDRRPWRGGGASVRRRARGGVAGLAGPSVGCAWRVIY